MPSDPSRDDMLAFLADYDFNEFDREEAMYWFASDYHSGQWSNLYSALCASPYQPSMVANRPTSFDADFLYSELASEFGA